MKYFDFQLYLENDFIKLNDIWNMIFQQRVKSFCYTKFDKQSPVFQLSLPHSTNTSEVRRTQLFAVNLI